MACDQHDERLNSWSSVEYQVDSMVDDQKAIMAREHHGSIVYDCFGRSDAIWLDFGATMV